MKTKVEAFVEQELPPTGEPYCELSEHAAKILRLLDQIPALFDPRARGRDCPFCDGGTESGAHKAYCKREELRQMMRQSLRQSVSVDG